MKRFIFCIYIITTLFGCTKKHKTELIINEIETTENVTTDNNISLENTKPLIEITPDDELLIIVRSDGAPGMFLNEQNLLTGFYVELEELIMKEMGQNYRFITYTDLGSAIQLIKNGEVHSALATPDVPDFRLLANISSTFEILNFIIFLQDHINEEVPENKYDAIKYLYGKKVGVQTRGHIFQLLRDHPEIELVEYPTTTVAMEALHRGEVDAVPEVKRISMYYRQVYDWKVKSFGPTIFELNIGTGFSKKLSQSIVYRYNIALQKLIDSGLVDELYNDYFNEM